MGQFQTSAQDGADTFESRTADILQRVRNAFAAIVTAIPGNINSAADLHRALKLNPKLGWKILKVARAPGPLASGPHVPGPANMKTFLKAAAKSGVPQTVTTAAAAAAEEFEGLVTAHAGDRATFDSMVRAITAGAHADQITPQHLRAAFRANRDIWGVQARTLLRCMMIHPAANPQFADVAKIEGYLDLRRLRHEAPLAVAHVRTEDDDGTVRDVSRQPLDPGGAALHGIALLREFCSRPLPQLRVTRAGQGRVECELLNSGVGNRASVTCITACVEHGSVPRYASERNRVSAAGVEIRSPCEVLVLDLLIHEDVSGSTTPVATIYGEQLYGVPDIEGSEPHRLPLQAPVVYLGRGPSVLHTPDVPRYAELSTYVFDRLGWDGTRFSVYRCRIEYPVMPSTVLMRFDLPKAPTT